MDHQDERKGNLVLVKQLLRHFHNDQAGLETYVNVQVYPPAEDPNNRGGQPERVRGVPRYRYRCIA